MKRLFVYMCLILIGGLAGFFLSKKVSNYYYVDVLPDATGWNISAPKTAYLAKVVQSKLNLLNEDGKQYTDSLVSKTINISLNKNFEDDYSRYCKTLKVSPDYYELLFYNFDEHSSDFKNYFICTPNIIYKMDSKVVKNDDKIIRAIN